LNEPHRSGLKPTLRQLMIFVLWAALLAAAIRAMIRFGLLGDRPEIVFMMVPIMFGFNPSPVLAILLWLLDRPVWVNVWVNGIIPRFPGVLGELRHCDLVQTAQIAPISSNGPNGDPALLGAFRPSTSTPT
jgi:hypothetical protein